MPREGRRTLGTNGDMNAEDLPIKSSKSKDDQIKNVTTMVRLITVLVYIFCVSIAATLLSLYYIFLWVPQPSESMQRTTHSTHGFSQHGNSYVAGGSFSNYPKNSYPKEAPKHAMTPSRGSKKSYPYYPTTVSPTNFLPKPQYLSGMKGPSQQASQSTPNRN